MGISKILQQVGIIKPGTVRTAGVSIGSLAMGVEVGGCEIARRKVSGLYVWAPSGGRRRFGCIVWGCQGKACRCAVQVRCAMGRHGPRPPPLTPDCGLHC
jgi:hypothetical protein